MNLNFKLQIEPTNKISKNLFKEFLVMNKLLNSTLSLSVELFNTQFRNVFIVL